MFGNGPFFSPPPPILKGERVFLQPPRFRDFRQWSRLRGDSRAFLEPWEPSWGEDALSRATFRDRTTRMARDWRADTAYSFHIFDRHGEKLVGGINLNSVRRGVAQTASLGYWLGEDYARRGLMSAGLSLLLPFAFRDLHLHRLEAACLGGNEPSQSLLRKFGFRSIGIAHSCLKINGRWQDHMLFDLIFDDLMGSRGMAQATQTVEMANSP
ncbi:MAG: GNAT family protein [Dongiaceae bacterium]